MVAFLQWIQICIYLNRYVSLFEEEDMKLSKNVVLIGICALFLFALAGCKTSSERKVINSMDDLNSTDIVIGYPESINVDEEMKERFPNAKKVYMAETEGIQAIVAGRADAQLMSERTADSAISEGTKGIKKIEEPFRTNLVAVAVSDKSGIPDLISRVNEAIIYLKDNGAVDDMLHRWIELEDYTMPDIPAPQAPEHTLKIVTAGELKPMTFFENNELTGLDMEFARRLGERMNMSVEFYVASWDAIIMGVASGKYDLAISDLYITEERQKSVAFSEPYLYDNISFIVADREAVKSSQWDRIKEGFYRSVIEQDRYKLLLSGLGVTLIITFGGFVLANLLGILMCTMMLSGSKALQVIADIYSKLMHGTPIVVILMILFYIVFGNSSISGVVIAIIGFGMNSGAYLGQMFAGAVTKVPWGQKEAAMALGLTRWQTLMGVTVPQAINSMLPAYFSELIGLMKGTAVVGYIAVIDLTKSGDIIRAGTFQAIAPLLVVTVLYFTISTILLQVMKSLKNVVDPLKRKRGVKGVNRQ